MENPATLAEIEAELEKHRGKSIVVLGPGGAFTAAVRAAYFIPFTEQFGIEVIEDTPTPNTAKWVAAAETGNIDWDVDYPQHFAGHGSPRGPTPWKSWT